MSNEIAIGEYVRTNKGIIAKVIGKDDDNNIMLDIQQILTKIEEKSVKHSKNITELLEDTDILKVEISEEWVEKEDTIKFAVVGQTYTIDEVKECLENGLYKITQILTHEQFEQNSYKVGV